MRTKSSILILCIVLLAALTLACVGPGDEWAEWQNDVMARQQAGLPTSTVEVGP